MTTLRELGEKQFIRKLLSGYARTARIEALDDCIVIDPATFAAGPDLPCIVYSMDHPSRIDRPLPDGFEWRFFGRWAAACVCNDVLAMGAQPQGFSIDLATPVDTELDHVSQLYQGITDVLEHYGAELEGGNLDITDTTSIVGVCWGTVARAGLIRRRGARPGDHIAVTTELGVGWASYVLRQRDLFGRLTPHSRTRLEQYNLMPVAPHRAIVEAAQQVPGAITSGMDLSDGLAEFLNTIGESSGWGAVVEEERIPTSTLLAECAALLGVPPVTLALEYGFDMPRSHGYTVDPAAWERVSAIFSAHGTPLFRVGEVTREPGMTWRSATGRCSPLPQIWDDNCRRDNTIDRWFDQVVNWYGH